MRIHEYISGEPIDVSTIEGIPVYCGREGVLYVRPGEAEAAGPGALRCVAAWCALHENEYQALAQIWCYPDGIENLEVPEDLLLTIAYGGGVSDITRLRALFNLERRRSGESLKEAARETQLNAGAGRRNRAEKYIGQPSRGNKETAEYLYMLESDGRYKVGRTTDPIGELEVARASCKVSVTLIEKIPFDDADRAHRLVLISPALRGEWLELTAPEVDQMRKILRNLARVSDRPPGDHDELKE